MCSEPCESNDHRSVVDYLESVYKNIGSGFGADHAGGNHDSGNLQYGEVTYAGMESVYESLGLEPGDTFYDLGSGTGKLVLYVALRGRGAMSKGLEFGERRHGLAESACRQLSTELQAQKSGSSSGLPGLPVRCTEFEVHLADITKQRYADASVVAMNNVCMDMGVQSRTLDCLLKSPIKRLICVTAMPPHSRLKLKRTIRGACTWAKVVCWHIYEVLPRKSVAERRRDNESAAFKRRIKLPMSSTPTKSCSTPTMQKNSVLEFLPMGRECSRVTPAPPRAELESAHAVASLPKLRRSSVSAKNLGPSSSIWRGG